MALGRGLASLIPQKKPGSFTTKQLQENEVVKIDDATSMREPGKHILHISLHAISTNPDQPRKQFREVELKELADSIREHGVLQPLLVREIGAGNYQLIAGERRLQASKLVGLTELPVIVKEVSDQQNLEIALVENIQRHDLNAIEEAKAFQKLHDEFGLSQEEIAKKVGKQRATIANTLRLMDLPQEVKNGLIEGKITEGHARAILSETNRERQIGMYHEIVDKQLTVRQAEALNKKTGMVQTHERTRTPLSPVLASRISEIEKNFGTKIAVTKKGNTGSLGIQFFSDAELEALLQKLEGNR